jgi:uncharacterized protein YqeY
MTLRDRIGPPCATRCARDEQRTQTLRMAMSAARQPQIELGRSLADEDYLEIPRSR